MLQMTLGAEVQYPLSIPRISEMTGEKVLIGLSPFLGPSWTKSIMDEPDVLADNQTGRIKTWSALPLVQLGPIGPLLWFSWNRI